MQPTRPDALYFQGAHRINLPHLFFTLLQAEITYKFLGTMPIHQAPSEAPSEGEILCLQLTPESYSKFQRVFVQKRFVAVNDGCDRCFWDSRTDLTVHIVLATAGEPVPTSAPQTLQSPLNKFSTVTDTIHSGNLPNPIRMGVFC